MRMSKMVDFKIIEVLIIRFPDLMDKRGNDYNFITSNGCYKKTFTVGEKLTFDPGECNVEHTERGLIDIHNDSGEYLTMCEYLKGYLISIEN